MPNVFVEPLPEGRSEGTPIDGYVLEFSRGTRVDKSEYKTQDEAIEAAKAFGHCPRVALVRSTDKDNLDHWRTV